jgi:hypothetical protein
MIDLMKLATGLQALLERELGRSVAVVDHRHDQAPFIGAAVVASQWAFGDIYSGGGLTETIRTANLPVELEFDFAFHQESGQCDDWTLGVKGASAALVEQLRTLFASSQYAGHWRNNQKAVIVVDGVESLL